MSGRTNCDASGERVGKGGKRGVEGSLASLSSSGDMTWKRMGEEKLGSALFA